MLNEDLEFLVNEYGFLRIEESSTELLRGDQISFTLSHTPRDGYETEVSYSRNSDSRFSLGTLLAALDVPETHRPAVHAKFLRSKLEKLSDAPSKVRDDLFALRFWHAARWRREWGSGIMMDAKAIEAERSRLSRLRKYFGVASESANAKPVA
jgi:hypothetical protein